MYAIVMYREERRVLTHRYLERALAERMTIFLSKRVKDARFKVVWMGETNSETNNGGHTHED